MAKSLISSAQAPVSDSNKEISDPNSKAGDVMYSDTPIRDNAKPLNSDIVDDLDPKGKSKEKDTFVDDLDPKNKAEADEETKKKELEIARSALETKMGEGGFTKEKWDALSDSEREHFKSALTDEQKKQLGIEDKKSEDAPKGAPEKYEDFKIPEGMVVVPEMMEKTRKVFKDLNLSQEQAQALIDLNVENARAVAQAGEQMAYSKFEETRNSWVKLIQNDPEVGRGKFDESQAHVAKARKFFGGKDESALIEALDVTGAGDNPAIYKFLVAVGRSIKNDTFVDPSESGKGEDKRSAEAIMYG